MSVKGRQSEVRTRYYRIEARLDPKRQSKPSEPLPVRLLMRLKGRIEDWEGLADRFRKAAEDEQWRILCEALGIELRSAKEGVAKCH